MPFSNRLKEARKKLGITQQTLADTLKCNQATIADYEKGRIEPSLRILKLITENYNISSDWLLTGNGEMFGEQSKKEISKTPRIQLPIEGEISAGEPLEISEDYPGKYVSVPSEVLTGNINYYYAFLVNGNSMQPEICHNDVVIIQEKKKLDDVLNKICAVRVDGELTLKKLILDKDGKTVILMPISKDHKPIVIDDTKDTRLLGKLAYLSRLFD